LDVDAAAFTATFDFLITPTFLVAILLDDGFFFTCLTAFDFFITFLIAGFTSIGFDLFPANLNEPLAPIPTNYLD
jgi:hypothetical protein